MGQCLSICRKKAEEDDEQAEKEYEKDQQGRTKKNKTRIPVDIAKLGEDDDDSDDKIEKDKEIHKHAN